MSIRTQVAIMWWSALADLKIILLSSVSLQVAVLLFSWTAKADHHVSAISTQSNNSIYIF